MSEKTLSPAEAMTLLTQRRPLRAAQATRRETAGNAAASRPGTKSDEAVRRHKFRVGQTVMLAPNRYGGNRSGGFKVTVLLPQENGINQYRLKSNNDGHERVATESELN